LAHDQSAASKAASQSQLIARAQRGEEEAFAELFELHKRRVYSLCLRMTGDTAEAEDLTQEAFLQLFRKIATFRGESAFSTWLHRLVVNVVLMHLRRKGLQKVSLDEADTSQEEPVKREYGDDDRRLLGSVERIALKNAIEELPPGYRAIFVLHDVEGYEHNEIAQIMNCSVGNSKSQLHKARLKLREALRRDQTALARRSAATGPGRESHENGEGKRK
jgi:RNA polymerase sigma-70 factor, ECF subfamily